MDPVTDPALLAKLRGSEPVSDPDTLKKLRGEGKPPVEEGIGTRLKEAAQGAGEFGLSAVTGAGADVIGGFQGMGAAVTHALGLEDVNPSDVVKWYQDSLTYQPKTKAGKAVQGAVGDLVSGTFGRLKHWLGDTTFEHTNSPLASTAAEMFPDVVSTLAGAKLPKEMAAAAERGAVKMAAKSLFNQGKDQQIVVARRNNFTIAPSDYDPARFGQTLQTIAGKPGVEREASYKNMEGVDRLARLDMQLPPDAPLDLTTLAGQRKKFGQAYEQAKNMGRISQDPAFVADVQSAGQMYRQVAQDFPEAVIPDLDRETGKYLRVPDFDSRSAVDMMRILRDDASGLLKSTKPEDRALGMVKRDIADAFDARLERYAVQQNQPQLAQQLREARTKIAKIHVYEDALNPTTQHVSARLVLGQRNAGKFLSDEAATIADMAEAFPRSFQDVEKGGRHGPFSVIDYWMMAGGVGGSTWAHGIPGSATAAAAMGAASLARPGIRAGLTSQAGQKALIRPPSYQPGAMNQALQSLGDSDVATGLGAVTGAETGNQPE